jgi:LPS-assembly protein
MRNHWFVLSAFFVLFLLTDPAPVQAEVGEVSVAKEMKIKGPVDIEADVLIYERETQTYEAHGQVEVSRGDLSLKADHAQMNMETKELVAWGNVLLREGEDVIECQRLEVNVETRLGKIHQAKLFLKDQNFHITGREVEKLGENHYRLRDGSLTTCDAKRPPWKFTVKEIEVKEMALGGWGIAKGPIFYFEDIPVLYFPWGAFPVRQDRQSGFLIPQAGYSNKYGPELKNGFYWAFAKDMDATVYFDWLGDRGFKEGLEYRYAFTQDTKGEAKFYFISDKTVPYDSDIPVVNGQTIHHNRYAFFVEHEQKLPGDFYLKGDINRVSDHQYLIDFGEDLPRRADIDSRSARQLKSVLFGGKDWDQFSLLAQTTVYDNMTQSSNDETLQKLPEVSFYAHRQSIFKTPLFYDLSSSYSNFWREKGVEAHRGDLFPRISFPTRLFNVLKFNSDLGVRETVYGSTNDPTGTIKGWNSRQAFEGDMQMSAEFYRVYDAETFSSKLSNVFKVDKWMHTIEPTVSYTYIPPVNQSHLPAFDEVDQIPFTNQITYGITQRLVGKPEKEGVSSGPSEYGKLIISQNYSLGDPFTDVEGKKRSFSNIQGELWWNFGPYLSARCNGEYNPYRGSFDIINVAAHAKDQRNDVVVVQYRNTRSTIHEVNLDARVKTINPLYLFGSYYYNLLAGMWVQGIFGAEYQAQCWSVGFIFEDINHSPDGTQKKEMKFHVYFNLLNIGSVGHKPYFMGL